MSDKNIKKQVSGDFALQIQSDSFNQRINNINIINGVTKAEVLNLIKDSRKETIAEAKEIAKEITCERITIFTNKFCSELDDIKSYLNIFKKPEVCTFLSECCISAAQTDQDSDYDILSKLLIERIKNDGDKFTCCSLKYAVKTIPDLDDDSLLSLTLYYCVFYLKTDVLKSSQIFQILDNLYGNILCKNLPEKINWLEQLDILKCIRISQFYIPIRFIDIFEKKYTSLFDVGIKENSENFFKTIQLLKDNNIPLKIFIPHEFNPGYYRLNIASESDIDSKLVFVTNIPEKVILLTLEQKNTLHKIYNLYETDKELRKNISINIENVLNNYPHIKTVIDWMDKIKSNFVMTPIGVMIGNANARIYSKDIQVYKIND